MKKLLLLFAVACLIMPIHVSAQYSNASLNGPWIIICDNDEYIIFDGQGGIKEIGFEKDTLFPVGTYSVSSSGLIAATLNLTNEVSTINGHLLSDSTSSIYVDTTDGPFSMFKVSDTAALAGTWTGYIFDSSTLASRNIQFTVNGDGIITSSIGIPLITGKIFESVDTFAGYLITNDTNCSYLYIQIYGSYTGDSLNGIAELGRDTIGLSNPCRTSGTVHLTKIATGVATIHPVVDFSVYPDPFTDLVEIAVKNTGDKIVVDLFDILGRKIYSKQLGGVGSSILNLGAFKPGVYLLMLTTNDKTISKRIVKK